MFEVFTSVNISEDVINSEEVVNKIGSTFLYLIKRGEHKNYKKSV